MKTYFLAAVALAALTSAAAAADLPRRELPVAPVPAASIPAFSWTGFYLGAHAGGAVAGDFDSVVVGPVGITQSVGGYTVGGTVGYNYQFGVGSGIVIGVEGDVGYSDIRNNAGVAVPGFGGGALSASTDGLSANARGRLGYAFDRVLVYGTGGYAYTDAQIGLAAVNAAGVPVLAGRATYGLDGYTVGGGVEAAFLGNWSAKAEYLYSDYDPKAAVFATNIGSTAVATKLDTHVLKVGVNYRFGGNGLGLFGF